MKNVKKEETLIQEVDVNIDELLGTPGADSVMNADEEPKRTVFTNPNIDLKFLDKEKPTEEEEEEEEEGAKKKVEDVEDVKKVDNEEEEEEIDTDLKFLNEDGNKEEEEEEEDKNKGGRPSAIVTATKSLIEEGVLTPFINDDGEEEDISKYSAEDFQELISANFKSQKEKSQKEIAEQFYTGLPQEMQQAYEYIANGGTDIKGMFSALASTAELSSIDVTSEDGQKQAIRAYLQTTQWGTPEEIEEEILSLQDKDELEKKANQFKPKLDAMQDSIIKKKIADQAEQTKLRQEQSKKYIDTVYTTLEKGALNGLELDNKTQNLLYSGLVQSNYNSISGKPTNMLGHLLEKYQWVEPNHELIAEALWLLADPEGYRGSIKTVATKETNKETFRKLKTEQQTSKSGSHNSYSEEKNSRKVAKSGISRNKNRDFFKRSK